jgi:hypothetical protein
MWKTNKWYGAHRWKIKGKKKLSCLGRVSIEKHQQPNRRKILISWGIADVWHVSKEKGDRERYVGLFIWSRPDEARWRTKQLQPKRLGGFNQIPPTQVISLNTIFGFPWTAPIQNHYSKCLRELWTRYLWIKQAQTSSTPSLCWAGSYQCH